MKSRIFVAALVAALAPHAQAVLVDQGVDTFDTATGLQWLDLSQTSGMTFAQVSAQLGAGGAFAGYRYATAAEAQGIFMQFGLPLVVPTEFQGPGAVPIAAGVKAFQALFSSAADSFFSGLVADIVPGDANSHPLFSGAGSTPGVDPKRAWASLFTSFPTDASTYHDNVYGDQYGIALRATDMSEGYRNGSFLVRQVGGSVGAVPEPGSWSLLLTGLGAGVAWRRRRSAIRG
ncbi:MAG: PEP-CTERM sorting domain-containing protein [Pseudomonadota bacterium]|nr:PEP-CTERM sorting domain-containing protein [Pseudomonadota bacterium]